MTDSLGENLVWRWPAFHLVESFSSPTPTPNRPAYLQRVNGLCTRGECHRRGEWLWQACVCVVQTAVPGTEGLGRRF